MGTLNQLPAEKAELEAVLASETFRKSPNLARLLQYVCAKYFEDRAEELKEYNIAVEGLGRPADFDPGTNAIVRVEVRRLREKLRKYYENEGADHNLRITIELGRYVPQFTLRQEASPTSADRVPTRPLVAESAIDPVKALNGVAPGVQSDTHLTPPAVAGQRAPSPLLMFPEPVEEGAPAPASPPRRRRPAPTTVLASCILLVACGLLLLRLRPVVFHARAATGTAAPDTSPGVAVSGQEVRILAGYPRDRYIDRDGRVWAGDRYFQGGEAAEQPVTPVRRAGDPKLFAYARTGDFSYDIPLKAGVYEMRLYFADTSFEPGSYSQGGESSRIFSIDANGAPMVNYLDVFSNAGSMAAAYVRAFKDISPAADGFLHLKFRRQQLEPFINAIEIVPGVRGHIMPIRMVTQSTSYTDSQGRVWLPDDYVMGGRLVLRSATVRNTTDPGLFAEERFGNFSYAIPVPPGRYTVTLYFAETYWGQGNSGLGGAGNRVFDVNCNGTSLLRNFDVFAEAGGARRAISKTFHGLQPNAAGELLLSFTPTANYAEVNAIEVLDESK